MRISILLRGLCAVLCAAVLVLAGEPWKDKPYTEWTEIDVLQILQTSPWVHKVPLNLFLPGRLDQDSTPSGANEQAENQAILERVPAHIPGEGHRQIRDPVRGESSGLPRVSIRWLSSRTMREAMVRLWQLRGALKPEAAKELLELRSQQVAIGLMTPRSGVDPAKMDAAMRMGLAAGPYVERIQKTAYLQFNKSKRKIRPDSVTEVQAQAMAPAAELMVYFPLQLEGEDWLAREGNKIKFYCEIIFGGRMTMVEVQFDLTKMMRDGKPDL